jgi:hypothetical protein
MKEKQLHLVTFGQAKRLKAAGFNKAMKTLELKDIAGYFPHELKVLYEYVGIADIETIGISGGIQLGEKGDWRRYHIIKEIENCKPILRPLSDLYKPIIHNGKEIIPIVECAKITHPKYTWRLVSSEDRQFAQSDIALWFNYNKNKFFFTGLYSNMNACLNQVQLFDFLNELKIDYRGLIDAGLAVSVYDLENNPYK